MLRRLVQSAVECRPQLAAVAHHLLYIEQEHIVSIVFAPLVDASGLLVAARSSSRTAVVEIAPPPNVSLPPGFFLLYIAPPPRISHPAPVYRTPGLVSHALVTYIAPPKLILELHD